MKNSFWFILLLLNSKLLIAQSDIKQTTGIIHKVPIIVKTHNYLFSYNYNDTFKVEEGRFQLYHYKRNLVHQFDQLLQLDVPINANKKVKVGILNEINGKRQILFLETIREKSGRIIDTILNDGNTLTFVWLDYQSQILQKLVFSCSIPNPSIIGFRTIKAIDGISQIYKARRLNRDSTLPKEFEKTTRNLISLKSLGNLELIISKPNLIQDSLILFRFFNQSKSPNTKWIKSGHLITLKDVKPGNFYFLEIKYIGQTESNLINIITKKEFYQEGWFSIPFGLFILFFTFWIVKWYYKKRIANLIDQRNRVEDKLKMVQSQLNPHFVFNALSSIEGLVSNGDNELATQYLANFSSILRETLKNADRLLISLEEEISLIDNYCKVEKLRFGFSYNISIDKSINLSSFELPPLLMQPIVENAVKHGLAELNNKGLLEIKVQREVSDFVIIIKNNHNGIKTNIKTAGGYGIRYLIERINHLNLLNKENQILYDFEILTYFSIATLRFKNWLS